eukprot:Lithocolla_globosa_v1_NODE_3000_length_1799_cov_7.357798.p1 type:complete len:195 gc:universal NODE_3000_length_1799_cov_7.357798:1181-597(-)
MVEYLTEEHPYWVQHHDCHLNELPTTSGLSKLECVDAQTSTIDAYKQMLELGVTGLGIINITEKKRRKLVDVMTVTDFVYWSEFHVMGSTMRFSNLISFRKPILDFVQNSRSDRNVEKQKLGQHKLIKGPSNTRLFDVVQNMMENNVHHYFVVDDGHVTRMLTYHDVLTHYSKCLSESHKNVAKKTDDSKQKKT